MTRRNMTNAMIPQKNLGQLLAILLCFLALTSFAEAQIQSITAAFGYTAGGTSRPTIQRISAVGGKFRMSIHVYENISIGVNSGYASYSIDQTDQLNQWNWNFWTERYYPKIQSDMRADPNLTSVIGSVQTMDAIPVLVNVEYNYSIGESLTLLPTVGGGIVFYTRKLYVDETWTKKYPSANYSITYSYRNFAPDKKGNFPFADLGCELRYQCFSDVSLQAGVHYTHYNPVNIRSGYGDFPLENEFTMLLGLTFKY